MSEDKRKPLAPVRCSAVLGQLVGINSKAMGLGKGSDRVWYLIPDDAELHRLVSLRPKQKRKLLCPTCRQDLTQPPRDGESRKDCPQCGQGLSKRTAIRLQIMRAD